MAKAKVKKSRKVVRRTSKPQGVIPVERIAASVYVIRGQEVMIDADLAFLYGAGTKVFNQAVRRNERRFPEDFMFRLTAEEAEILRSQVVTSSWGGRRYLPYAFTGQGVAMLSSVLRSERAMQVNIGIMRTFVRIRHVLGTHEDMARKVEQLDKKVTVLFEHVRQMLTPAPEKRKAIGFRA